VLRSVANLTRRDAEELHGAALSGGGERRRDQSADRREDQRPSSGSGGASSEPSAHSAPNERAKSLPLVLQGVDRLTITERVYLAVPRPARSARGRPLAPERPEIRKLCRRLGLGLILVGLSRKSVEILEEPVPYRPRQAKSRALRLIDEFARRIGDANVGGAVGVPLVTAYRQDALRCARALALGGPMRVAALRAVAGVPRAARILQRNVYGWFDRIERGTYRLTPEGDQALSRFAEAIPAFSR
jgi:hypothetical protein